MAYSNKTTNIIPYFDDFDSDKNFIRMLFNPARAVQARELTQLQTILQNQISSFGNHIFKDGSSVLGGEIQIRKVPYLTITTADIVQKGTTTQFTSDVLVGRHIRGSVSNALAKVVEVKDVLTETKVHLLMRGGEFVPGELFITEIYADDVVSVIEYELNPLNSGITSVPDSIKASINAGVVYVGKAFVQITEEQVKEIIVVAEDLVAGDEYKIGFNLNEETVTIEQDETLKDPSSGTNHGAPGADRYKVSSELVSYKVVGVDSEVLPDNFYNQIHIKIDEDDNSIINVLQHQPKTDYADIADWLARRTYDESGSYTTTPYGAIAREIDLTDPDFYYDIMPGKSYIQGYEHEHFTPKTITASKGRTSIRQAVNESIQMNFSSYVTLDVNTNLSSDNIGEIYGEVNPMIPFEVELHNVENPLNSNSLLGTAKVIFITKSGTIYKIYLTSDKNLKGLLQETVFIRKTDNSIKFNRVKYNISQSYLRNSTIVELPYSPVKSLGAITYTSEKTITSKSVINGTAFNLDLTGDDRFESNLGYGYFFSIINESTNEWHNIAGSVSNPTIQQITADASHGLPNGTYTFIVRIERYNVSSRTKELREELNFSFTTDGNGELKFSAAGFYDILDIIDVTKDNDGSVITDFSFDDGQRDDFYDYGTIKGLEATTDYTATIYRFFHNTAGDFFSVMSYDTVYNQGLSYYYPEIGGPYLAIPIYTNSEKSKTYSLRSCLDFRRNITESSRYIPMPSDFVNITYDYYLPRKDKIWIDKAGNFGVTEGIPEEIPKNPPEKADTLTLFEVHVPAYVFVAPDVLPSLVNTKNYTMAEIHKLENRIENMEYYSSINQLRIDSESYDILDGDGFPMSKNGIFIDPFNDHTRGETLLPWYRNSMDYDLGILRCPYDMETVQVKYESEGNYISVHPNTITLEYTLKELFVQPQASGSINLNPYDVFVWAGEIQLNPISDFWVDTINLPALQVNMPEVADSIRALYENVNAGVPRWGQWKTNIIGQETVFENIPGHGTSPDGTGGKLNWNGDHWFINQDRMLAARDGQRYVGETHKIVTTDYRSTRTGTITELTGTRTVTKDFGDRVVDVSQIPWMRTINMDFEIDALKPDTELLILFADVDITLTDCHYYDIATSKYRKITGIAPHVLKSDSTGHVKGRFVIPEKTFYTGTSDFTVVDRLLDPTTTAATEFTAAGILQTKQRTILSVEVPTYTTRYISGSKTNTTVDRSFVKYYDPIAETFLISDKGGVFVKEIDIFFRSKDNNIPVTLQLVETDNGYPTQKIVPFGKTVVQSADINATYIDPDDGIIKWSSTHYNANGSTKYVKDSVVSGSPTDFISTTFTFSDPVFLKEGSEYAFVLLSNSNNYESYVSNMGDYDLLSGERIAKQPFTGVMFKSQNASTWTADQNRDIKFEIRRCEFTDQIADFELRGELKGDPWVDQLYTYVDETEDADKTVVAHSGKFYELIATANPGEDSPDQNPTKWLQTIDSEHEVTLINPVVDDMILPNTLMTYKYIINTNDTPREFVNKQNIDLSPAATESQASVVSLVNDDLLKRPKIIISGMQSYFSNITPVINRNRSSIALINNLVISKAVSEVIYLPYTGESDNVQYDSGKYISKFTSLKTPATDLRVLIDTFQINSNVDVTVKFRTTNADKRYVDIWKGMPIIPDIDETIRDTILYVYHFNDVLLENGGLVNGWTQKSQVIIDGFGIIGVDDVAFISSIGDYEDFNYPTTSNERVFVTSEPDILGAEIFDFNTIVPQSYTHGDYAIYHSELYQYIGITGQSPGAPAKDVTDWEYIPSVFIVNDSTVQIYFPEWQEMKQVIPIPEDFVLDSGFIEREFVPNVTPSDSFDTYSIMIEMWSDTALTVPLVQRLRSIAVD